MRAANLRALAAEFVGTGFLLIAVVGSGIMAERLSDGNAGLALLANAVATGAALFILIGVFAKPSGAHFNPAVTLVMLLDRKMVVPQVVAYVMAQIAGGISGVWVTHMMFAEPVLQISQKARFGAGQWLAEAVATFGLVMVILGLRTRPVETVAAGVGLYITGAYWFTASTSFANPAVTIARALSDTFAGIAPGGVVPFIVCQCVGAVLALGFGRLVFDAEARKTA